MVIKFYSMLDIIKKAREYKKTKSITTAVEVCNMLNDWADARLESEHE